MRLPLDKGVERPFILSTTPGCLRGMCWSSEFRSGIRVCVPSSSPAPWPGCAKRWNSMTGRRPAGQADDRQAGPGERPSHRRRRTNPLLRARLPRAANAGGLDHHHPWLSSDASATDRFTYRDLPDHIDLVLITHGHHDHIVLETCSNCTAG